MVLLLLLLVVAVVWRSSYEGDTASLLLQKAAAAQRCPVGLPCHDDLMEKATSCSDSVALGLSCQLPACFSEEINVAGDTLSSFDLLSVIVLLANLNDLVCNTLDKADVQITFLTFI